MSKIKKEYISLGTGSHDVQASVIPANLTPTNYTPATTDIKGHLQGLDTRIGTIGGSLYDIAETSYSKTSGVTGALTDELITGFNFPEANVRGFEALLTIQVDTTADLWETVKIIGIQKGSASWFINVTSVGDTTVTLGITSSSGNGRINYSIGADASRTAINMKFRATAITV